MTVSVAQDGHCLAGAVVASSAWSDSSSPLADWKSSQARHPGLVGTVTDIHTVSGYAVFPLYFLVLPHFTVLLVSLEHALVTRLLREVRALYKVILEQCCCIWLFDGLGLSTAAAIALSALWSHLHLMDQEIGFLREVNSFDVLKTVWWVPSTDFLVLGETFLSCFHN